MSFTDWFRSSAQLTTRGSARSFPSRFWPLALDVSKSLPSGASLSCQNWVYPVLLVVEHRAEAWTEPIRACVGPLRARPSHIPLLHQVKQCGAELERTLGNCGFVNYTCIWSGELPDVFLAVCLEQLSRSEFFAGQVHGDGKNDNQEPEWITSVSACKGRWLWYLTLVLNHVLFQRPVHLFIWQMLIRHILCARNSSRLWGHRRE